jgi:putative cardiolipin synthase
VKGRTPDAKLVFANLQSALGEPQQAIDLVSPYFVPGSKGTKALAEFAARGVMLRILTNSLSATDVAVVHAGYAKRRKPLLRAGARIYELKSELRSINRVRGRRRVGRSAASLHAKTFSVDRKRVFVGSLNLDPRSVHLNTEMGLVIESPALAAAAAAEFDRAAQDDAYEVVLESGRLGWVESRSSGKLRLHTEPNTSFLKRLLVRVFASLPIEWLL